MRCLETFISKALLKFIVYTYFFCAFGCCERPTHIVSHQLGFSRCVFATDVFSLPLISAWEEARSMRERAKILLMTLAVWPWLGELDPGLSVIPCEMCDNLLALLVPRYIGRTGENKANHLHATWGGCCIIQYLFEYHVYLQGYML